MNAATPARPSGAGTALALAAAATGVRVGAAMAATRSVIGPTGSAPLALPRYAIGALCPLPVVSAVAPCVRFAACDLVPVAPLGVARFGVLIALLNRDLARVPAGRGALIFASRHRRPGNGGRRSIAVAPGGPSPGWGRADVRPEGGCPARSRTGGRPSRNWPRRREGAWQARRDGAARGRGCRRATIPRPDANPRSPRSARWSP